MAAKISPLRLAAIFGPLEARRGRADARARCGARSGPEGLLDTPTSLGPPAETAARGTARGRRLPGPFAHRRSESSHPCRCTPREPPFTTPPRAHRSPPPPPQVQLFLSADGRTSTLDVDGALTVGQLKDVIEDESFIPADLQRLSAGGRDLTTGTLEDNELADGSSIELLLNVAGGGEASRYKKSTSKMRAGSGRRSARAASSASAEDARAREDGIFAPPSRRSVSFRGPPRRRRRPRPPPAVGSEVLPPALAVALLPRLVGAPDGVSPTAAPRARPSRRPNGTASRRQAIPAALAVEVRLVAAPRSRSAPRLSCRPARPSEAMEQHVVLSEARRSS